jgi:acetoin utilization deacetylase AcuC-like enzyme
MARPLALVTHPACFAHDAGDGHPESRARLPAILAAIRADHELGRALVEVSAPPAELEDLLRVHSAEHVALVRDTAARAPRGGAADWLDPDTAVSELSYAAALGAAGTAIAAAELVATGDAPAAFALARPPGHHARPESAAGFCLFANVAIAARRLQARGLARRVLVVDLDVHHGDGTQAIFWDDPSVYALSLHLADDYPGTGSATERGSGRGAATTRNVPLPRGTTGLAYRRAFAAALDATLAELRPDVVLVAAGFDCLAGDPLGGLAVEPEDLHAVSSLLVERTHAAAGGRVAAVLEGGYVPERLGAGAVAMLRALAGLPLRAPRRIPAFVGARAATG